MYQDYQDFLENSSKRYSLDELLENMKNILTLKMRDLKKYTDVEVSNVQEIVYCLSEYDSVFADIGNYLSFVVRAAKLNELCFFTELKTVSKILQIAHYDMEKLLDNLEKN